MRSWPKPYMPPPPEGIEHPTLQLFDSYQKRMKAIEDNQVTSYVCGITPYDATHLGHAATYLAYDLIHRYLAASGKTLTSIQNVTDIDDPLLERAKRDGQNWQTLAVSQIDLFRDDMTELRVIPPDAYQGVIESMTEIVSDIAELKHKGLTYAIDGDLYLDVSRVGGAIENLPMPLDEALEIFAQRGGDPQREGKKHPLDTLLWLAAREGEPAWESTLGQGRPGWHIECLSIARHNALIGNDTCITIQGGGSDLLFPHHYMTNVQALALTGKPFAEVYTHSGMIGLDGEKMSKSKGNLLFISKLLESGLRPQVIRLALLSRHYRDDTMWDLKYFPEAEGLLSRLESALSREEVAPTKHLIQNIVRALADDLDTEKVFLLLREWCEMTESGMQGGSSGELARALDLYLGIAL